MGTIFPSIHVPSILLGVFQSILIVWGAVWWIVLPLIAIMVFWDAWKLHLHYKNSLQICLIKKYIHALSCSGL